MCARSACLFVVMIRTRDRREGTSKVKGGKGLKRPKMGRICTK